MQASAHVHRHGEDEGGPPAGHGAPAQQAAFQAGSGITAATLLTAVASIVLILAFVWVIWVAIGTFRAWQEGQATVFDLTWSTLRACIVLMVLGFYLR